MPGEKGFLVVCLNPTLQKTLVFENFRVGSVNRAKDSFTDPSGKGVNVCRVLAQLGASGVTHLTQTPLEPDRFVKGICEESLFALERAACPIAVRTCTTAISVDPSTRRVLSVTEMVEEGFEVPDTTPASVKEKVAECIPASHTLVLSGSAAKGFPDAIFGELVQAARRAAPSVRVILDIRKAPLQGCLPHRPDYLKVNLEEFASTFLPDSPHTAAYREDEDPLEALLKEVESVASRLHAEHGTVSVVTLGSKGALAYDPSIEGGRLVTHPAVAGVEVANTIGCGDSFTAGFALDISRQTGGGTDSPVAVDLGRAVAAAQAAAAACAAQIRPGRVRES